MSAGQANGKGTEIYQFLVLKLLMSQFFCHRSASEAPFCFKRNCWLCHNLWKSKSLHLGWQEYNCRGMKGKQNSFFQRKITVLYYDTNAVYLRIKNEAQTMHYTIKLNIALFNHRKLFLTPSECSRWTVR